MSKKDDQMAATLARMRKSKAQGSGDYIKIEDGKSVLLRILPAVGDMEIFYQQEGRHFPPGKDKQSILCSKFTTDGSEECPLCELSQAAYKSGDKELNNTWRVRKSFKMNVMLLEKDPVTGEMLARGPIFYTPGIKVFEQFYGMISDPDYGEIYDVDNGFNIKVSRSGIKRDTVYQALPAKESTPLADSPEAIKELLEKATDLSLVLKSLPTREEAYAAAGLSEFVEDDDSEEELDEDF